MWSLAWRMVNSPKWKIDAASTAVAWPCADAVDQMVEIADAAGGDDRYRNTVGDRLGQRQVEALPGAVAVHRGQQDFAGAERDHFLGVFDGVDPGGIAPAMGEDLPALRAAAALDPLGVDRDHDALLAEFFGALP